MTACLDCDKPALWALRCKYHNAKARRLARDVDLSLPRCLKGCGRAAYVNGVCKPCRDHAYNVARRTEAAIWSAPNVVVKLPRCACGNRSKHGDKCGQCLHVLKFRCRIGGPKHEWVRRFGETYCRACKCPQRQASKLSFASVHFCA